MLVQGDHLVDAPFVDRQRGQVREKIVPHEEAHEHKIVDHSLEVILERERLDEFLRVEFDSQIFPQHGDPQQAHRFDLQASSIFRSCRREALFDSPLLVCQFSLCFVLGVDHDFPDNIKMRLMRCQPQHDQVRISPVETVPHVRVVVRRRPLGPNEVHDLVFSFPWIVGIREDDLQVWGVLPCQFEPGGDVESKSFRELVHERSPRGDLVAIEFFLLGRDGPPVCDELFFEFSDLLLDLC
mmetsp:Transcript_36973/g.72709  ORF Transcript_36973/g.72709 Transcript_36973/m.72709 type:complete len:240 (-) Transcript_36973:660-1379(-)